MHAHVYVYASMHGRTCMRCPHPKRKARRAFTCACMYAYIYICVRAGGPPRSLFFAEEGEAAQLSEGVITSGGKGGNQRGGWSLSGLRAATAPAPPAASSAAVPRPTSPTADADEAEEAEPFVPLGSRIEARIIREPPSAPPLPRRVPNKQQIDRLQRRRVEELIAKQGESPTYLTKPTQLTTPTCLTTPTYLTDPTNLTTPTCLITTPPHLYHKASTRR